MRTTTIEQVLGPVAEMVSEMLLALDNPNAIIQLTDEFHHNVTIVTDSVNNLVKVVQDMVNTSKDEQLRADMPKAAAAVKNSAAELSAVAGRLRTPAADQQAQRAEQRNLVNAAKSLVSDTNKVLECLDDYEIRRIVASCAVVRQHIDELLKTTELELAVTLLQPTSQALLNLAKLANARVNELLDPDLKAELTQAANFIRTSTTLFISSYKAHLTDTKETTAAEARALSAKTLVDSVNDVERIVTIVNKPKTIVVPLPGRIARAILDGNEALIGVHAAAQAQDAPRLDRKLNDLSSATDSLVANAKAAAQATADPELRSKLLAAADAAEKHRAAVDAAAKRVLANPNDPAAQQALVAAMKDLDGDLTALTSLGGQINAEDLQNRFRELGDPNVANTVVGELATAARNGQRTVIAAKAKAFNDQVAGLSLAVSTLEQATADPDRIAAIDNARRQVERIAPQVVSAAHAVAVNVGDGAAQAHFNAVLNEWQTNVDTLKKTATVAQQPDHVVAASVNALHRDIKQVEDATAKKQAQELLNAAEQVIQRATSIVEVVQREIKDNEDAAYQKELNGHLVTLNNTVQQVRQYSAALAAVFSDASTAASLKSCTTALSNIADTIETAIKKHVKPPNTGSIAALEQQVALLSLNEAEQAKAAADPAAAVVQAEEEEPEPLSEADAKANPIKASAQALKIAASRWDRKNNPLVSRSSDLAEKMKSLSNGLNSRAPKEMIESARGIVTDIKEFERTTRELANRCTDIKLRDQLLATIAKLPTIANQLKILATVQAANPNDSDSDNESMLEACAGKLMEAVKMALESSHSASLRQSMEAVATAATAAIHWRRQVFANKGGVKPAPPPVAAKPTAR